jgi:hypothetical protein
MIDYEANKIVWISEGSLNYSRDHIEWLLPYLYELEAGNYPDRHIETGYLGGNRATQVMKQMKAILVYIEVSRRLSRTGTDRLLVEMFYCWRWSTEKISKYLSMTESDVINQIEDAITYIASGDCPRWLECSKCGRFGICQKKKKLRRRTYTYQEWVRYRNRERSRNHVETTGI